MYFKFYDLVKVFLFSPDLFITEKREKKIRETILVKGKKHHLLLYIDFLLSTNFNGVTFILPMLFCILSLLVKHHYHEYFAERV